ncbi:alpha/beta fold hydrolase [Modestobacter sp. VKM Ac-2978]|uniref:alpha/beta fold hydrolase n=1 Tax=Modestobacter sp. VKM Ac-2978 TaxID=3004132 RepID=UPI0022AB2AA7|nr:alpha/beta hydrolase [Modestobacter sp. VKM Ac-2978]MCZ2849909.1 alpha/beta hydrolase [Modestobacter sp. VKM Ac-2978]
MSNSAPTTPTWARQRDPDTVAVGDVPVALRREGSGEPLLYLHDAWFARQWLPFHAGLASQFDVLAPEHPGFGDTPQGPGFEGFLDYVLHYDALLDTLGLTTVHLAGHGLGARIAAHLATVYPHRFATLTLIAPSGLRGSSEPLVDAFRMSPEQLGAAQFNGREERYAEFTQLKGFPDDALDAYADSTAHALLTWTNRFDRQLERRLGRISSPTLVVAPEEERIAAPSAAARYAELIPGARVEVLHGQDGPSAHALPIENPNSLAELVASHASAHPMTEA